MKKTQIRYQLTYDIESRLWDLRRQNKTITNNDQLWDQLWDQLRDQLWDQLWNQLEQDLERKAGGK